MPRNIILSGSVFAKQQKSLVTMKKFITFILAISTVVFSASTCEKMEPGDYRDFTGAKINLLGSWVLTEVQY